MNCCGVSDKGESSLRLKPAKAPPPGTKAYLALPSTSGSVQLWGLRVGKEIPDKANHIAKALTSAADLCGSGN